MKGEMDKNLGVILITGANAGIGFATCKLLLEKKLANKIIIGCRSQDKVKNTIEQLIQITQSSQERFGSFVANLADIQETLIAAETISEPIDHFIMNAGGAVFKVGEYLNANGATQQFSANVLGHAAVLELLIKRNKLKKGARVAYGGSEGGRGIKYLSPIPEFTKKDPESLAKYIDGTAFKKWDYVRGYAYAKSMGALYVGALARKYPDYFFVTISPGATYGTNAVKDGNVFLRFFMKYLVPKIGGLHSPEVGALRYLDFLLGDNASVEFKSGRFYASENGSLTGNLSDQGNILNIFNDTILQDGVYNAMHRFIDFEKE
ncbi:MAG: SDR family NAD(P)-dependent oxidoreductase [Spirochaetota bacterium]